MPDESQDSRRETEEGRGSKRCVERERREKTERIRGEAIRGTVRDGEKSSCASKEARGDSDLVAESVLEEDRIGRGSEVGENETERIEWRRRS